MVACKKCQTENSLDSLFCKQCGDAIAAEERTDAQQKLQELISEGYRIFNEGRTDEARLVAEAALEDNPHSTSALSLKGMCHERAGEIAEALAVYEKVVEMNPDSALDKIKVTHLRQSLTGRSLAEPEPRRGRALMGAMAAVILVVAVGIAVGAASPTSADNRMAQKGAVETPNVNTSAFDPAALSAKSEASEDPKPTPPGPGAADPPITNPPAGANTDTRSRPRVTLPDFRGNTLPNPLNGGIEDGNRPITPNVPTNINVVPDSKNPATRTGDDVDPKIGSGPESTARDTETAKPAPNPGVIDISVSRPKPILGGSQDVPDSNGVEALLKTARQQFLLGRFAQAASSYEAALRAGASVGSTSQRLGQCYANLGNQAQAAAAYRRAISAFENAPDGPAVRAALEASRRALKTVGG